MGLGAIHFCTSHTAWDDTNERVGQVDSWAWHWLSYLWEALNNSFVKHVLDVKLKTFQILIKGNTLLTHDNVPFPWHFTSNT